MVRIYLDVETCRHRKEDAFINERVIAIGLLEDFTPYTQDSLNKPVNEWLFTEWELGTEEAVIKNFYNYLTTLKNKASFIVVVGFNILRTDIPLLIQKGVKFEELSRLNQLWHNMFTIDFFQLLLLTNKFTFKGLKLAKVIQFIRDELGCKDAPLIEEHGEKVAEAYKGKRYEDIEKWLKQDLYAVRYLDLSAAVTKLVEYSLKEGKRLFSDSE